MLAAYFKHHHNTILILTPMALPPETRQALDQLLKSLPDGIFLADDSLGWVYQFWQAEQKKQVNESGEKIGADALPAVTQLFTEDYMVLFLLHNTLGAWWAGKVLAVKPELADSSKTEEELRAACAVQGYDWSYLRFSRDEKDGKWRPAAGTFDGWPRAAKDLKVLDPCMGSGHFLVFALPTLAAFRMEEEGLSRPEAVAAALRVNLFGLEIDNRCTQVAAFNLALAAWKMTGYRPLPPLNLACSGVGTNAREDEWVKLAGSDHRARETMRRLCHLFEQAPVLGSLIDPKRFGGTLFTEEFKQVEPLLERALAAGQPDVTAQEMAVAAKGLVEAARILVEEFTLVATNVPYLGRGKQDEILRSYCEEHHAEAKSDLATCFVERCLRFCHEGGSVALVTPQNWLFLTSYKKLRESLLKREQWDFVARLGEHAFESSAAAGAFAAMLGLTRRAPGAEHVFAGWDVAEAKTPEEKACLLPCSPATLLRQTDELANPDAVVSVEALQRGKLLDGYAVGLQGISSADNARFRRCFWEITGFEPIWSFLQSTPAETSPHAGRQFVLWWGDGTDLAEANPGAALRGDIAHGKRGVAVARMRSLPVTLYTGELFDDATAVVLPYDQNQVSALWCLCSSPGFHDQIRKLNRKVSVANATLVKVPFDLAYWQRVAAEKCPNGLPKPHSDDPTQWLFNGHPKGSDHPLQVAVARLLGYCWPRQTGSSFMDCPALGPDGLESHAARDGIVCLSAAKGALPAAGRLRALLADAFGSEWSPDKQAALLAQANYAGGTLEDWLRDAFFEQHCALFHQRPFIWNIWDGLRDGFHALVNYHKLAAPNGEGRQTLEKLIYTYLGDWIDRQRADQKAGVEGADGRVAAAAHLKNELEKLLEGELPYDIFVRWRPLHGQPMGWEPDINDGVRLNIRPFTAARPLNGKGKNACILRVTPKIKWEKDRGKEPHRVKEDFPWFWSWDQKAQDFRGGKEFDGNRWNDLHYTRALKQSARERQGKGAEAKISR